MGALWEPLSVVIELIICNVQNAWRWVMSRADTKPCVADWFPLVQVRVGLESVDTGAYQVCVGQMRLLGELYNYRVVDSK